MRPPRPETRKGTRAGGRARLPRAIRGALSPPDVTGSTYTRIVDAAHRTRVAIGLTALVAVPLLPGTTRAQRTVLWLLIVLAYLPYSVACRRLAARREGLAVRILSMIGDLLIVAVFAISVPATRDVALFGYFLIVAFYSCLGGRGAGLPVAGVGVALVLSTEATRGQADRLNLYTLAMYAASMLSLVLLLDAVTSERRTIAAQLSRVHKALAMVRPSLELAPTLDAIAESARDAVGAKAAFVLLEEAGRLVPAAGSDHPVETGVPLTEAPWREAFRTGAPVVVNDADSGTGAFTTMASIPLSSAEAPIGVLNVYFAEPGALGPSDVDVLVAYAEQAALVIVRAIAYEEERQAAARLEAANRLKDEFVATVSHELRTPLTAVKGFLATVVEHWEHFEESELRDMLARASANADQLARTIEQLLDFSGLEAGHVSVRPCALSLRLEAEKLVKTLAPILSEHRVELNMADLQATFDPEALEHILSNLLSNAVKFGAKGTTIRVSAGRVGDEALVAVRDEGCGIPAEQQSRIFERFYQLGPMTRRGTGIGLAIVRAYVELLGGRVWVESVPGEGSTFLFTLPLADGAAALAPAS